LGKCRYQWFFIHFYCLYKAKRKNSKSVTQKNVFFININKKVSYGVVK